MPYLIEQGFSRGIWVWPSGVSIAYGLSKFLMGNVSDQIQRALLPLSAGLLLSAGIMFMMGTMHWATSSIGIMFVLLFLNGWAQGHGWPPAVQNPWCTGGPEGAGWDRLGLERGPQRGRRHDRPLFILGMGWFNDWRSAFYVPAAAAAAIAVIAFFVMRDTPQSVGLPPSRSTRTTTRDYRKPRAGVSPPRDLHEVRAAQQAALVHRHRQRLRLPHPLRRAGLPTYLKEARTSAWILLLGLLPL